MTLKLIRNDRSSRHQPSFARLWSRNWIPASFVIWLVIAGIHQFRNIASVTSNELIGFSEPKSLDSGPAASTNIWDKSDTFMVQIGANDGVTQNIKLVSKLLVSPTTRAILVEGNPSVFSLLEKNVKARYDPKRILAMNALVCPKESQLVFWVVSPKLKIDFPNAPHWVLYQLGSLERNSTLVGVDHFFSQKRSTRLAADYIEPMPIPCSPFQEVLDREAFLLRQSMCWQWM